MPLESKFSKASRGVVPGFGCFMGDLAVVLNNAIPIAVMLLWRKGRNSRWLHSWNSHMVVGGKSRAWSCQSPHYWPEHPHARRKPHVHTDRQTCSCYYRYILATAFASCRFVMAPISLAPNVSFTFILIWAVVYNIKWTELWSDSFRSV